MSTKTNPVIFIRGYPGSAPGCPGDVTLEWPARKGS